MIYLTIYLLISFIWSAYEMHRAPVGYEDEGGFHYGEPKK